MQHRVSSTPGRFNAHYLQRYSSIRLISSALRRRALARLFSPLARRILSAKLRALAKMPGFVRMRLASSRACRGHGGFGFRRPSGFGSPRRLVRRVWPPSRHRMRFPSDGPTCRLWRGGDLGFAIKVQEFQRHEYSFIRITLRSIQKNADFKIPQFDLKFFALNSPELNPTVLTQNLNALLVRARSTACIFFRIRRGKARCVRFFDADGRKFRFELRIPCPDGGSRHASA